MPNSDATASSNPELPALEAEKDPQFAYTLAKGLEVLRAFDVASPALGNREIAQRTGIGRQTVVRLTRTLSLLGYLKYHEPTARYRLAAPVHRRPRRRGAGLRHSRRALCGAGLWHH